MVLLGFHTPVPPPRWDAHHVKIIEGAHNKVIHHRKAQQQPIATTHLMVPIGSSSAESPSSSAAAEISGNYFSSHRNLQGCMTKHTRIVCPKRFGAYETSSSAYGRKHSAAVQPDAVMTMPHSRSAQTLLRCGRKQSKVTAYSETLLVTRQKPVDTQWQNHLYMADPS